MQTQDITTPIIQQREVVTQSVSTVDVVVGQTTKKALVLTPEDNVEFFNTPKLGVFKHRPGAATDAFSTWLGRDVDVAVDFANRTMDSTIAWNLAPDWSIAPCSTWVKAKPGRNLSYALPMYPETSGLTLQNVADGAGDPAFKTLANRLMQYGLGNAYLRPGWEMDLAGTKWGKATQGSGQEPVFAAAFRRIVNVMRSQQPSNNWKFEIVTGQGWNNRKYLDAIWPGDEFVDHVGMDFYEADWFAYADGYPYPSGATEDQRLRCQQEWWNRYSWWLYAMRDFSLSHGKKMCLPEWSCANLPNGGQDSPHFIRKMHEFINDPYNAVEWSGIYSITNVWQIEPPTAMPLAGEEFKRLFATTGRRFIASGGA
jgi:hypothetical protein